MANQPLNGLLQHIRNVAAVHTYRDLSDSDLLERFVGAREEAAFTVLIERHGPMVLGVCRRALPNLDDAEDACQATFLVLARKAASVRKKTSLSSWLHGVACRIAISLKRDHARRKTRESAVASPPPKDPAAEVAWREVQTILDEELQRLPERYRAPLILCYLECMTRDEAEEQLGLSRTTLHGRLERARDLLRQRLTKRGLTLSAVMSAAALGESTAQAALSATLVVSSTKAAMLLIAGQPLADGIVATHNLALTQEVIKSMFLTKLKLSLAAVLCAGLIGVGIYAGTSQADPPRNAEAKKEEAKPAQEEKVVALDDPLPAGSTMRFGTSRYRYGTQIHTLAVSPDGKMAFAANDNDIPRVFDLATGRVLYSLNWGSVDTGSFSSDSRTLVFKQGNDLCLFDAATGKELRTIKGPREKSWSDEWLALTPNGKAIAVASEGNVIHLIDFESGKTIRDFSHDNPESALAGGFSQVFAMAFSPDGKLMARGGYENENDNYFARLWDVETGKELRRFMHGKQGYGIGSLAFSPDGKTLATLGTQAGVFLRLFDVGTGKELRAFPKDGNQRTLRGSVAFSPDGKTVAATLGSIHLYDTATGEERLRIDRRGSDLHFTDGGKTLSAAVSGAIYRWDTATGKVLTPEAGDSVVEKILVTPDGSRVVTLGQDGETHIWNGTSGKHLRRFQAGWQCGMAMSHDGRFLAWPVSDDSVTFTVAGDPGSIYYGSRIRLYDIASDQFVDRLKAFKGDSQDLAFTSDGKKLVTADGYAGMVRVWNFADGKEERSFHVVTDDLKKQSFGCWRARVSPDGKTVAVEYQQAGQGRGLALPPHTVRLWDVATGKELPQLNGYPIDGAFSPDGRFVVTRNGNSVYEISTGDRVAALPDDPMLYIRAAAFSRDGRFLAIAVPEDLIQIWEVATWTKRNEFQGYRDRSITLTFGPGGQLLSGNADTTVLAWDIRPPRNLTGSFEAAWLDLVKQESSEAYKAEGRFLASPSEAVKLFADKIKSVEPLDSTYIQQLLADLDNAKFALRESASKTLGDLGQQAKPYLEEAIKNTSSTEVLDRARKILNGLKKLTPEQVRQTRMVLVLELIDDDESRNLLKRWAAGLKGALLTEEASAALKQLKTAVKASP